MRRCFCGCGRVIPRFPLGMRSINRRGKQVQSRMARTRAMFGDREPELLTEWFADGRTIAAGLRAALHGEVDPNALDERSVREWQRFGRQVERNYAREIRKLA